jgi:hypothetical protein
MLGQSLGIGSTITDRERFELGVATLLTLNGFHVIYIGKYFGKGFDISGVDLLVFREEAKQLFAISCTIDNRFSNKIEGLLSQVNKLRESLHEWNVRGMVGLP